MLSLHIKKLPLKNLLLAFTCVLLCSNAIAQSLLEWTPRFPKDNSSLTFTVNANKGNQGLLNFEGGNSSNVFVHVGVNTNLSTSPTDWRYVKFVYGSTDPAAKATNLGNNRYSFTIANIRTFFNVPAGETIRKVNVIFRNATGNLKQVNSDVSDMYIPIYQQGAFDVRFVQPFFEPRFVPFLEPQNITVGSNLFVKAYASANASITLKLNGNTFASQTNVDSIDGNASISAACNQLIKVEANNGSSIARDSFNIYIPPATTIAALPAGVQEGINYNPNNTAATLVLFAPGKNNAIVLGDFSNWIADCNNQMKKTPDGNYFWTTVTGLVPGVEYGFQYLVDNSIRIADPYTQKVLDQNNDPFINSITYPNLKPYPVGLTTGQVGILQTAEPAYVWQSNGYVMPDKKNLMIYELLIRDFTAEHSYQSLIDSFQYFKNLGINAIELMPINEFDGNESWGYNPSYFFAPDKYYGTKNKLKEFIDKCHQNGIAVILDVVYNHCTGDAPQAKLYWDATNNRPAPNNPWLNVQAPHPYSVFNDFNHTTVPTQYLVQRNLNFWLDEYKIDGYRFDLGKGFTQLQTNTTTVENFDASRVANLNRYYDGTIANHPNAFMSIEFLGTLPSQEEQAYATKGFYLWGNLNGRYSQNTMGFAANSNLSPIVYTSAERGFTSPKVIGYLESHDEERNMYRNITFGNSNGTYSVRDLNTALARGEAAAAVFFTVPGPKLIWQFGERGYDVTINFGGSNVSNKPPKWEYMQDPNRRKLYDTYKSLMTLRLNNPALFNSTSFTYDFNDNGGLVRVFQIQDPASAGKQLTVIANFDVVAKTKAVTFQSAGTWSNYISNGAGTGINGATNSVFTLTAAAQTITLQPGEYHVYVNVPPCTTPAPTVTTPVLYCQNATATALTATGTSLLWYTNATGGTGSTTAPIPNTGVVGSITYYVSQQLNSCEGPRAAITVTISATAPAPIVTPQVFYCQNATAIPLTATGTNLKWYTTPIGGTGSTTAPTPSTATVDSIKYYVSQTLSCGEGPRALITVYVSAVPAAPGVTSPIVYCEGNTATALTATGTNLRWYTTVTGGTGVSTAPTPSTAVAGPFTFYVSQTNAGCESVRAAIVVTVNGRPNPPMVTANINYCQNAIATVLTATGINLRWYTTNVGGTGITTAPTPSTTNAGVTKFYVSQTANSCESLRDSITVTVSALPAAPAVISPVTYCQNTTAVPLTATGTSLMWYSSATGGTGTTAAPTPSAAVAGSTTFYVSQSNACGESVRASIVVTITATPAAPTALNVTNITTNSATLTWTGSAGSFYTVQYKPASANNYITAATGISNTTVNINNLIQGTLYDWRVNANCAATAGTSFAQAQFTTSDRNGSLTNISNGIGVKISPNPVAGAAVIDYLVPETGTVSIGVYSARGEQLKELFVANMVAGTYQLNTGIKLNNLPTGAYFLKVQQNGNANTISFIKK